MDKMNEPLMPCDAKTTEHWGDILLLLDRIFHAVKHWPHGKIQCLLRTMNSMDTNWPEHLKTWSDE